MYISEQILEESFTTIVSRHDDEWETPDYIPDLGEVEKLDNPELIPSGLGLRSYNTNSYMKDFLSTEVPAPERCCCRKKNVAGGVAIGLI